MDSNLITAVGIDVSKGKSTVAIRWPGGEIVRKPFTVKHDQPGLQQLIQLLHEVGGEIRIVMEHTGMYWRPIASVLQQEGFYLSVVNAILTHQFNDNSLRKVKTDKADSLKLANYALAYWSELKRYDQEDETRQQLKFQSRLYQRTIQTSTTLRNGLISILDQTFPNANHFFHPACPQKTGTTSGSILWRDSGIKIAWRLYPSILLRSPSKNGAKETVTVTVTLTQNISTHRPGMQSPRFPKMIVRNC